MQAQLHDYDPSMRKGITRALTGHGYEPHWGNVSDLDEQAVFDTLFAQDPRNQQLPASAEQLDRDLLKSQPSLQALLYAQGERGDLARDTGATVETTFGGTLEADRALGVASQRALDRVLSGVTQDVAYDTSNPHVSIGGAGLEAPDARLQMQKEQMRQNDSALQGRTRRSRNMVEFNIARRHASVVVDGPDRGVDPKCAQKQVKRPPNAGERVVDLPRRVAMARRGFMQRLIDTITMREPDLPLLACASGIGYLVFI